MFAGIIEKKARILAAKRAGDIISVRIGKPRAWKLKMGQSINIDGVCSTVVRTTGASFEVDYMPETVSKTTAGSFAKGRVVNLERALKFGNRIDGHPVQGHVDTAAPVRDVLTRGMSKEVTIKLNASVAQQAILHGSIAINGVSLTVIKPTESGFSVAIIPHTWEHTTMHTLHDGAEVNIEYDQLAKYIEKQQQYVK